MENTYVKEVQLAGLLHDIGKFYQKSGRNKNINGVEVKGHHALISSNFIETYREKLESLGIDVDAVKEMCQRHHEMDRNNESVLVKNAKPKYKNICKLVSLADNLSSSERLEDTDVSKSAYYTTAPMTSIFGTWAGEPSYRYPVGKFVENFYKASKEHTKNSEKLNEMHIRAFANDFEKIEETEFRGFFIKLDNLLKQYLWCIPSDYTQDISDVSLYDHLKTTSAIAAAMYADTDFKEINDWNKTGNLMLVKVSTVYADSYILKNHSSKATGLEFIEENRKYVFNTLRNTVREILKDCGELGNANIVIDQRYTKYILISAKHKDTAIDIINNTNRNLSKNTGMELGLEISTIEIPKKDMSAHRMYEYINELNRCHANNGFISSDKNVSYHSIDTIITASKSWLDSTEVFKDTVNKEFTGESVEASAKIKEFIKNSENKTLAIVKMQVDNRDDMLAEMFKLHKADKEIEYSTISRISTATRMVNDAMALIPTNTIEVISNENSVIWIAAAKEILTKVNSIKTLINRMALNKLSITAHIVTFNASDELENVNDRINRLCVTFKDSNVVTYNGNKMQWSDIAQANELFGYALETVNMNKSTAYKLVEFINGYYEYERTGKVEELLGIARFFNNKEKHFNDKTISKGLSDFVTEQFKQINNGNEPSYMLAVLLEIIKDAISISIRE